MNVRNTLYIAHTHVQQNFIIRESEFIFTNHENNFRIFRILWFSLDYIMTQNFEFQNLFYAKFVSECRGYDAVVVMHVWFIHCTYILLQVGTYSQFYSIKNFDYVRYFNFWVFVFIINVNFVIVSVLVSKIKHRYYFMIISALM